MSVRCEHCGAIASYGNELGHKSDCPASKKPFDFKTLRRLTPEEMDKIRQQPEKPRTAEEEAAYRRMLTMPVDDRDYEEMDRAQEAVEKTLEKGGFPS